MKDSDKSKEELIWELKKLKQSQSQELEAKSLELKQLSQVLETVTSTLDLNTVVEKVLHALKDIFSFNQISIYLFNSEQNSLDVNHWYGDQANAEVMQKFVDFPLSIEWDDVWFIKSFLDNETLYVSPITEKLLKHYSKRDRLMFEWNPHKSIIIIPLQIQEKVIGVINFVNTSQAFSLTPEDIAQIERYVSQIATTINNAYLVKKTRFALEHAQQKEKELNHLNQVIQATNASLNFDDVFQAILTGLKDIFEFDAIGIQLVDEENKLLNIFKVYGEMIEPHHIQQWRNIQIASEGAPSVSSHVFAKGEVAVFPNITPDMPFADIDRQIFDVMSFSAYLAFPLVVRGQKIGVISFFRRHIPMELDEQKVQTISRYVDTLSNTIKNLKTHSELKNAYFRMDSLLNASMTLYTLTSTKEITQLTGEQLQWAFPSASFGVIFYSRLTNENMALFHSLSQEEEHYFKEQFSYLPESNNSDAFLNEMNALSNKDNIQKSRKNCWRLFSLKTAEGLVQGKLIIKGVNLKTQNENTLKVFMAQVTEALENRILISHLNVKKSIKKT